MKEHKCNSPILTYTAIYESDIVVLSLHFDVRCVALSSIDSFNDIINNTMKIACASVTCFPNFIVVAVSIIFLTSVTNFFIISQNWHCHYCISLNICTRAEAAIKL